MSPRQIDCALRREPRIMFTDFRFRLDRVTLYQSVIIRRVRWCLRKSDLDPPSGW